MNDTSQLDVPNLPLLLTLESLLAIEALDVRSALAQAAQLVAGALRADKVDVFLLDPASQSLVAVGTSDTPMGRHQREIGLDRVPIANGGHEVEVFHTGTLYHTGCADQDPRVLPGVRGALGVRPIVCVPLDVAGQRRGVFEVVSAQPDRFSDADLRFCEAVTRWVGMVAHRAELSERVAYESAAQARRHTAEELIRVLAHDLRTPLTPLRGHLDLIRIRAERAGRIDDVHSMAAANAALLRLQRMIDDLLDASRLEQGLFSPALRPLNLADLARQTIELLRTPESAIGLRTPEIVVVEGDPDRLRQALENLVTNALAHTPPGTPVTVEVSIPTNADEAQAVIVVQDEGPGIPPELVPTLFTRFTRGRSGGLGLGLYLARGIAEAHGGTLTFDSQPGRGTRFNLTLPLLQAPCDAHVM